MASMRILNAAAGTDAFERAIVNETVQNLKLLRMEDRDFMKFQTLIRERTGNTLR